MESQARTSKLDAAYQFVSTNASPTPSALIGAKVLEIKARDPRHMRRAVRRVLASDSRFQEVHSGLWETIGWAYDVLSLDRAQFRVIDLEVTGSDPTKHAIIDVAVFEVRDGRMQPAFSTLVNPGIPIPRSIQRLTGIDDELVQDAPTFEQILPDLLKALEGGIFVAHNASFDYRFLKTVIEATTGKRFTAPHLCTVKLSQRLIHPEGGSRKLHNLASHLGIPLENRHRAEDDAYATAGILMVLLGLLAEQGVTTVGQMKLFESGPLPLAPDTVGDSGAARSVGSP